MFEPDYKQTKHAVVHSRKQTQDQMNLEMPLLNKQTNKETVGGDVR